MGEFNNEMWTLFGRIKNDIDDWLLDAEAHIIDGNLVEAQKDVACADIAMHDLFEKLG